MNGKYSPEMRECVLRMLDEAKPEHPNLASVVGRVSGLLGMSALRGIAREVLSRCQILC